MATLAQFRTRIASKVGLDNNAASAEQQLIDSWVNEGVIEVLLALKCYVQSATMTTTVNKGDYLLDTSILDIQNIYVTDTSSQAWSLQRVEPEEILFMRRTTTATSAPPRFFAINGANLLMLYPTPVEVDTLTVYYVPRPTALANAADDPSATSLGGIATEYHKLIEWYALSEAADFADDASSQMGMAYLQKYQAKLKEYRRRKVQKGGNRLPRKLPPHSSRIVIPPRNDIDMPHIY